MPLGRYYNSLKFLERAEATIPIGSQTFSKSRMQYPIGISPFFIEKGKGANVWDIDGNKYIDLVNSLAAITLGYRNRTIDRAVRKQLKKGTIFSLPGKLETEVAELIVQTIPSAEMVRFGKNGSDATSAAIRLARAYTGRNEIAYCGYHGCPGQTLVEFIDFHGIVSRWPNQHQFATGFHDPLQLAYGFSGVGGIVNGEIGEA